MDKIFSVMKPMMSEKLSENEGVNLLIMMSDVAVKQKVGEAFMSQMQNSSRVRSTFFNNAENSLTPLPTELDDWAGQVASSIIALALAQCSSHGFYRTVNASQASDFLNSNLTTNNPNFIKVAKNNYQVFFSDYCIANNISFGAFLNGSYGSAANWGKLLADELTDASYINQEMIKLNVAVSPNDWYNIFFSNIYKVQCLNGAEVDRVMTIWNEQLKINEKSQWTFYEQMKANSYNMYTFMTHVQASINKSVTMTYPCGPGAVIPPNYNIIYGQEVNKWLSNNRCLNFIKGPSTSNVELHNGMFG